MNVENREDAAVQEPAGGTPEASAQPEQPGEAPTLQQQLEEQQQRAESYYASWQRAAADFANYKRRTEQERSEATKFANAMLILNILPVLDDLERALNSVTVELAGFTWIDGIRLIYRKLYAALESQGLAPIEAVGQSFDPTLHEAVMRAPGEEGKVLAEFQRGYTLHGRVIRPALVSVGAGGDSPAKQEGQESPTPDQEDTTPPGENAPEGA